MKTKKKEKGGPKPLNWILNIVIIVLSFFFIMSAGMMIGEFHDVFTTWHSADSFYYNVSNEKFFELVGKYHTNTQNNDKQDKKLQEYYGVAKYFEAASLYHAYEVYGDEEMTTFFKERMDSAEQEMGGWSITKKSIRKQLGMEE